MKSLEERIVMRLRATPDDRYCPACLALVVGAGLEEARIAVTALGSELDFVVKQADCSSCARLLPVIGVRH